MNVRWQRWAHGRRDCYEHRSDILDQVGHSCAFDHLRFSTNRGAIGIEWGFGAGALDSDVSPMPQGLQNSLKAEQMLRSASFH